MSYFMKGRLISILYPVLFFAIPIFPHLTLNAQQSTIQDPFIDYERVLQIGGITPVHNVSDQPYSFRFITQLDTLPDHPWNYLPSYTDYQFQRSHFTLRAYDPEINNFWRNLSPGGINNGAHWEGRGFTNSVSAGFHIRYRFLTASFRPIMIYNQNREFELSALPVRSGRSEFSYPFANIDQPQRFGDGSFRTFDPGQSYIRAEAAGYEAGLSNQNRWWGPALHYPIILSNNAPGFWHFFAGTAEPKDIYIGDLEATVLWGKLHESDYFDQQSFNDERYITGCTVTLNPKPVPNLSLGFSRIFYRVLPPEGIPVSELFKSFEAFTKSRFISSDALSGDDEYSQMLSLHGRWVFPQSGFELYGEWARNDHSWNFRDFLGEPEHSRAYMAGFQKSFLLSNNNILAVNAEIVQLENSNTGDFRAHPSYYAHHIVTQGYTHRGQVLGTGYGPGSNSQILQGNYYFRNGRLGGWARRTVHNNDYLYNSNAMMNLPGNANTPKYWMHNFEMTFGSSLLYFYRQWETELSLELTREYNNDYVYQNDRTHVSISARIRYQLSSLR